MKVDKLDYGPDTRVMNRNSFVHLRPVRNISETAPRGGGTVAYVINDDGTVNLGVSICSHKENFCKKVGRREALRRAMDPKEAIRIPFKLARQDLITIAPSLVRGLMMQIGLNMAKFSFVEASKECGDPLEWI